MHGIITWANQNRPSCQARPLHCGRFESNDRWSLCENMRVSVCAQVFILSVHTHTLELSGVAESINAHCAKEMTNALPNPLTAWIRVWVCEYVWVCVSDSSSNQVLVTKSNNVIRMTCKQASRQAISKQASTHTSIYTVTQSEWRHKRTPVCARQHSTQDVNHRWQTVALWA